MTQPRDELGRSLRKHLHCPMCSPAGVLAVMMAAGEESDAKPLRVVAYRKTSVRLGCRNCGLRFSIDVKNFATAVAERGRPPDGEIEAAARRLAKEPAEYLGLLAHFRSKADTHVRDQRNEILRHHQAGLAAERPRRSRINFPKRARPAREADDE
jgi:transcription elongation factor Elf1